MLLLLLVVMVCAEPEWLQDFALLERALTVPGMHFVVGPPPGDESAVINELWQRGWNASLTRVRVLRTVRTTTPGCHAVLATDDPHDNAGAHRHSVVGRHAHRSLFVCMGDGTVGRRDAHGVWWLSLIKLYTM